MNAQQYYELLRRLDALEKAVQETQKFAQQLEAQTKALADKRKTLSLPK